MSIRQPLAHALAARCAFQGGWCFEPLALHVKYTLLPARRPNALGLIVPHLRLDASFAAQMPVDGDLALISQSGEISAGILA